jgi:DNA-binding transcriptional MerR regulator
MAGRTVTEGYTAKQVTAVTGVSYQTLNHWARTGLVKPSIAQAAGTGTERVYSFRDLIALKLAVELRKGGVTTRALRKVIDFLRSINGLETPLSEARLVVTEIDVVLVRSSKELISVLRKPGQAYLAFVLDLPRTVIALREAAQRLQVA